MLIPFLDLEIETEVILTNKGRSRSHCRGPIPEKRSAVLFFSQKHHRHVQDVVQGVFGDADPILNSKIHLKVIQTHKGYSRDH